MILLPRCELLGLNEIFWISSGVSTLLFKKVISWKFPDGPVVRILRSHCRGTIQFLVREPRSGKLHGMDEKRKERKIMIVLV